MGRIYRTLGVMTKVGKCIFMCVYVSMRVCVYKDIFRFG